MRSSALLFGAAMMFGLAACGPDGEEVEPVLPGDAPTYQTEPATATPAPMTSDDSLILRDSMLVPDSTRRDTSPPLMDPLQPPPQQ